jgi:AAA ATPase domain
MNPIKNPFVPGAGNSPPELAGRSDVIAQTNIALARIRDGKPDRSMVFYGLRGVGKTVLLNRLLADATAQGISCIFIEAPEKRSLPALLAPQLRAGLLALDRGAAATDLSKRALKALAGFVGNLKLKYSDIELSYDMEKELGLADSGDLDSDLRDLFVAVGEAARERKTAFVIFIDELQYVPELQLASLIAALHACAQKSLPITLVGAGLPQLVGATGQAKSYAERLFHFVKIDRLAFDAAAEAIEKPARREDVFFSTEATKAVYEVTLGYPYFLQEWGKHCWAVAAESPISKGDVERATEIAIAELDASFFRVRFDRCTPSEKKYLRAMADDDSEVVRSADIALRLGRLQNQVAPTRSSLIKKGMIYPPAYGDAAFTVPLFAAYMRRAMPSVSIA